MRRRFKSDLRSLSGESDCGVQCGQATPMNDSASPDTDRSTDALRDLWRSAGLPDTALRRAVLGGAESVLPSSFAVGTAAQTSIAAAALAATELGRRRNGVEQAVSVDMRHAALEGCTHFTLDRRGPPIWGK